MRRPSYLELGAARLRERIDQAYELMRTPCRVCPRRCRVDRASDDRRGFCRAGASAVVSSFGPHFGEEAPLVGSGGSGTIFFTSCNLACVYCQNWQISQDRQGEEVTPEQLARMMLWLQERGCHNINFVSPTVYVPQILAALPHAIDAGLPAGQAGLRIPLVYNTGGYDSLDALRLLDGVFDIYMPDIKYTDERMGRYSLVKDYVATAKAALREMHRQVGDLVIEGGVAVRGMIIRHLVLPGGIAGTEEAMRFIAEELSPDSYVNVMAQYRPEHKAMPTGRQAMRYPELSRRITGEEYGEAVRLAHRHGLHRLA
ncbi:MAG: radical SAM protein [Dehalococcoidia bacterium]|nr:radical SAM protein [Dehalococcoidia bacterium]